MDAKLKHAVVNGIESYVEADAMMLAKGIGAFNVIETTLMDAMAIVGKLFGKGKMFLPQVIKSSRVMKRAVEALNLLLNKNFSSNSPIIVLATVKGDVHDIGKNIVATVLSCNNFKIIDLGIMVPAQQIVKVAQEAKASIIGLSGLISPSLDEMVQVARRLEASGCKIPLMVGGATTSKLHTALKLHPEYPSGSVVHVGDASKAVEVSSKLTSKHRKRFIEAIKTEYDAIATMYRRLRTNKTAIKLSKCTARASLKRNHSYGKVSMIGLKLSVFPVSNQLTETKSEKDTNVEDIKLLNMARRMEKVIIAEG